MGIEVRQLLIRSQVTVAPGAAPRQLLPAAELQRLRDQLLAECRALLLRQLQDQRER